MTLNKLTKGVVQVDYWFGKLVVHNLTFPQSDWFEDHIDPGGVRTLLALHHGRKMKSESLAPCRGRVNISGGSKIA